MWSDQPGGHDLEISWQSDEDYGSARWANLTREQLDAVTNAVESIVGPPNTLT